MHGLRELSKGNFCELFLVKALSTMHDCVEVFYTVHKIDYAQEHDHQTSRSALIYHFSAKKIIDHSHSSTINCLVYKIIIL